MIIRNFIAVICLSPALVYAGCGGITAANLLKICEVGLKSAELPPTAKISPNDSFNNGTCLGYFKGFIYMELAYSATLAVKNIPHATDADVEKMAEFCFPPHLLNQKFIETFVNYMHKHPEEASSDACTATYNAFTEAFPCKLS